jgi:hypothetical protein
MAETSMREGVREVAQQARPSEINPKLEEAVQNQPLLEHLLSFKVVLGAVAIGAVFALLLLLLASPMMAGVALFIVFFGAWFGLAALSYGKASERSSSGGESDSETGDDDDDSDSDDE